MLCPGEERLGGALGLVCGDEMQCCERAREVAAKFVCSGNAVAGEYEVFQFPVCC